MVFKVLCCVLLACTRVKAINPLTVGLVRTAGYADSGAPRDYVGSVGETSDEGAAAALSMFQENVLEAMESVGKGAAAVPSIIGKMFNKAVGGDEPKFEGHTETTTGALSEPSKGTTEAVKGEASSPPAKSKPSTFLGKIKGAASATFNDSKKGIEKTSSAISTALRRFLNLHDA